ncbi:hypothetical protein BS78_01G130400 [Paspalum vaginatum]|nr:hypothetical protein BS78_01G130400 [Paspalum vaginatum]
MAVEAHQLLHIGGGGGGGRQKQLVAHAGAAWAWAGDDGATAAPASAPHAHAQQWRRPCYGGREVAAAGRPIMQHQFQHSSCVGLGTSALAPSAPPMMTAAQSQYAGQLCAADVASESGVTFGGGGARHEAMEMPMLMAPARKRKRAEQQGQAPVLGTVAAADVAAHFQQQLIDVDRLVLQHTAKMWAELAEQRRRHARQVVATVEAAAAKRLRAKGDEIERIGRLNWALEERVKSLYVEAQVWRDLAQSNEAAANALRGELKQTLDAQQARHGDAGAGADDAESACCGDNGVVAGAAGAGAGEEGREVATSARRGCAVCGGGLVEVLLLPCRHLCLCTPCAGETRSCPACGCPKNGSICVNFS